VTRIDGVHLKDEAGAEVGWGQRDPRVITIVEVVMVWMNNPCTSFKMEATAGDQRR
jgi:hypothetical protein